MKILINEKLSEHKYKTPEGYLICVDSVLARTGKQTYRRNEVFGDSDDDSEIEIDRPAKEVFSDATLASFENKPITVEHPDEDVNAENYKDYAVGFVRDVHKGVDNGMDVIVGTLVITDAKTIEEIENGEHTDLSCGYDCDITDEENPQQRNIRGNHVALCAQGRAGNARIVDTAMKDTYQVYVEFYEKAKRNTVTYWVSSTEEALQRLKKEHPQASGITVHEKWFDSVNDEEKTMTKDEIIDELLEDGNSFTYKNVLVIKTPYGWKFKLNGKTYEVATDEEAKEEIDESVKDCDMKDDKNSYRQLAQEINQKFAGKLKEKVGFNEDGVTSKRLYNNKPLVKEIVNFIKSKGHKVEWNDIGDDGTFYIIDSMKLDKIFNNDSLIAPPENVLREVENQLKRAGFSIEKKQKHALGKGIHYQIRLVGEEGDYDRIDLKHQANILHKITEYADKQGCPTTWNIGLNKGIITAGVDVREKYVKDSKVKDATNNKEWELVCKTFCKKIGATLLFVNDYSFGYEDKNGRMIHMSADELQRYLQRNNINLK